MHSIQEPPPPETAADIAGLRTALDAAISLKGAKRSRSSAGSAARQTTAEAHARRPTGLPGVRVALRRIEGGAPRQFRRHFSTT